MKKAVFFLLSMLVIVVGFSACNPSDNKLIITPPVSTMTAVVNGVGWAATSANGTKSKTSTGIPTLSITGTQLVGNYLESINIKINNYQGTYSYNIADTSGSIASFSSSGLTYNAISGQVHVSTDSVGLIRGDFSFNTGAYNLAQGYFQCTAY